MNLIESTYSQYIHDVAGQHALPEEAELALQEGFRAYCESVSLNEGRIMDWIGKTGDKVLDWYADKLCAKPVRTILATMLALLGGATGIAVPVVNHDISCGHYWPASVSEDKVYSYGIDTEEGRNGLIAKAEDLIERLSVTNKEGQNGADILKAMVAHIRKDGSENDYLDLVAMVECADGLLRSIETGTCANGDTYRDQGHVTLPEYSHDGVRNGAIATGINLHNIHRMHHVHPGRF